MIKIIIFGMKKIFKSSKKEDKYGLIDYDGKEILKPEYEKIEALKQE